MARSQVSWCARRFHHVVAYIPRNREPYTVQATATDTSGFAETVQSAITILPAQPPTVQVTPSNLSPLGQRDDHRTGTGDRQHVEHRPLRLVIRRPTPARRNSRPTSDQVPVSWKTATPATKVITRLPSTGTSGDDSATGVGTVTSGSVNPANGVRRRTYNARASSIARAFAFSRGSRVASRRSLETSRTRVAALSL